MLKRTVANMASGNVVLPEPLAARVRAQAEVACVAAAALATMDPELQGMTLHLLALRDVGVYPGYGSERLLAAVARALKKPITSRPKRHSRGLSEVAEVAELSCLCRRPGFTLAVLEQCMRG